MTPIEKLVNFFGGQAKTAAALGVTQAAVSYWFHGAHTMSATKAFLAEELTGGAVTARELCTHPKNNVTTSSPLERSPLLSELSARFNSGNSTSD